METKFRWLVEPVLPKSNVDALVNLIWRFDEVEDLAELVSLIKGPGSS
jgi:hypothetical protein